MSGLDVFLPLTFCVITAIYYASIWTECLGRSFLLVDSDLNIEIDPILWNIVKIHFSLLEFAVAVFASLVFATRLVTYGHE